MTPYTVFILRRDYAAAEALLVLQQNLCEAEPPACEDLVLADFAVSLLFHELRPALRDILESDQGGRGGASEQLWRRLHAHSLTHRIRTSQTLVDLHCVLNPTLNSFLLMSK